MVKIRERVQNYTEEISLMNSKNTILKRKSFHYVASCSLKQQMQDQQSFTCCHTVLSPGCTSPPQRETQLLAYFYCQGHLWKKKTFHI